MKRHIVWGAEDYTMYPYETSPGDDSYHQVVQFPSFGSQDRRRVKPLPPAVRSTLAEANRLKLSPLSDDDHPSHHFHHQRVLASL
jgi:hypothetical protein